MLSLRKKVLLGLGVITFIGTLLNVLALGIIRLNESKVAERKQLTLTLQSYLEGVHKASTESRLHLTNYRLTGDKNEFIAAQTLIANLKGLLSEFPKTEDKSNLASLKSDLMARQAKLAEFVDNVGNSYRRAIQSRLSTNGQSDQIIATLFTSEAEVLKSGDTSLLPSIKELENLLHQAGAASLKLQADTSDPALGKMLPQLTKVDPLLKQVRAVKLNDTLSDIFSSIQEVFGDYRTELAEVANTTKSYSDAVRELDSEGTAFDEVVSKSLASIVTGTGSTATRIWEKPLTIMGTTTTIFATLALTLGFWISSSLALYVQKTITVISESVHETAESAKTLSHASQSLAEGASTQSASLESTSAAMEEIACMVLTNNQNTHHSKALSGEAKLAVTTGRTQLDEMNNTLIQIKAAVSDMNQASREMQQEEGRVADIIKNIHGIAFQTNLLALNAAVEAARAGTAGLGFAVVADEVRNLAQRSAQAATETTERIESSIQKSHLNIAATQRVSESVNQLESKCQHVVKSFEMISNKTSSLDTVIESITGASGEQHTGIEQIRAAIVEMDLITQSNAKASSDTAEASQQLADQVHIIKAAVHQLEVFAGVSVPDFDHEDPQAEASEDSSPGLAASQRRNRPNGRRSSKSSRSGKRKLRAAHA